MRNPYIQDRRTQMMKSRNYSRGTSKSPMVKSTNSDFSEGITATDRLINRVNEIDEKTDGMIAPGS